jgi:hypothetical protein
MSTTRKNHLQNQISIVVVVGPGVVTLFILTMAIS